MDVKVSSTLLAFLTFSFVDESIHLLVKIVSFTYALVDNSSTYQRAVCTRYFLLFVFVAVVVGVCQILELFETPPEDAITREDFVHRIIDVFVQRRRLQLTLGDYEVGKH